MVLNLFLQMRLPDGGPVYMETDLSRFVAEPWNTATAFLFLMMAFYWGWRVQGKFVKFSFLSICLALLTVGGIGGTLYHAFRNSTFFLYMDWLPIMIICIMASGYFMLKVFGKWYIMLLGIATVFLAQFLVFRFIDPVPAINISYAIMGTLLVIPTALMLYNTRFYHWWHVVFSFSSFLTALTFRVIDAWGIFPMGTHFLWHIFGALAGHFMIQYIYELYRAEHRLEKQWMGKIREAYPAAA